ncbi:MAG: hypothetical protein RLN96_07720, partial [Pseudomonadales bacterium]
IEQKHRVVLHCWAGIGRSGLLAATILVRMGHDSETVFDLVSKARGESIPETQEQEHWFNNEALPYMDSFNRLERR